MAISAIGTSYLANSLGLSTQVTGAQDVTNVLRNQLAEQAKKRGLRRQPSGPAAPMSPAAFDLLGPPNGTR